MNNALPPNESIVASNDSTKEAISTTPLEHAALVEEFRKLLQGTVTEGNQKKVKTTTTSREETTDMIAHVALTTGNGGKTPIAPKVEEFGILEHLRWKLQNVFVTDKRRTSKRKRDLLIETDTSQKDEDAIAEKDSTVPSKDDDPPFPVYYDHALTNASIKERFRTMQSAYFAEYAPPCTCGSCDHCPINNKSSKGKGTKKMIRRRVRK